MIYLGIDPGLDGAVAAINARGKLIRIDDAPTLTVKRGKGSKRVYLEGRMVAILQQYSAKEVSMVALENVHAMPGQGVTSMFSMGIGFGLWRGILAALGLPVTHVAPTSWKRDMGIPTGADKGASIVCALQLFPGADLRRKKDHGRADALLIAEYARRHRNFV